MESNGNGVAEGAAGAEVVDARAMPGPNPEGYRKKCCPLLSSSMLGAQVGKADQEIKECLGPQCMLFVPIGGPPDENGVQKLIDAQCALALIPSGLSMLNGTIFAGVQLQAQAQQGRPMLQTPGNFKNIKR